MCIGVSTTGSEVDQCGGFADRIDWKCKAKEEVKFTVQVFKNENLLKDVVVDYELGPEYFPTVVKKDIRLADGKRH